MASDVLHMGPSIEHDIRDFLTLSSKSLLVGLVKPNINQPHSFDCVSCLNILNTDCSQYYGD